MRTTFEKAKHVLRSRLVNPKWLEGMKRHGYKGAGDISHMMDHLPHDGRGPRLGRHGRSDR